MWVHAWTSNIFFRAICHTICLNMNFPWMWNYRTTSLERSNTVMDWSNDSPKVFNAMTQTLKSDAEDVVTRDGNQWNERFHLEKANCLKVAGSGMFKWDLILTILNRTRKFEWSGNSWKWYSLCFYKDFLLFTFDQFWRHYLYCLSLPYLSVHYLCKQSI